MHMPVRELLERVDSAELSEWLAFDLEYNLPDGFYQAATVSMAVVRAMTGADVGPSDFAPIFEAPSREQSPEEGLARLGAFAKAHNKRVAGAK